MSIDLTPDPGTVVQAEGSEYPLREIPVSVDSPVQTRELPAVRAGYATFPQVTSDVAVRILTLEPRRKSATLVSANHGFYISGTQAGALSDQSCVFVPTSVAFEITHLGEVWARAGASGATDISVMTTWWSE